MSNLRTFMPRCYYSTNCKGRQLTSQNIHKVLRNYHIENVHIAGDVWYNMAGLKTESKERGEKQ